LPTRDKTFPALVVEDTISFFAEDPARPMQSRPPCFAKTSLALVDTL
jgi:hypothetical protein